MRALYLLHLHRLYHLCHQFFRLTHNLSNKKAYLVNIMITTLSIIKCFSKHNLGVCFVFQMKSCEDIFRVMKIFFQQAIGVNHHLRKNLPKDHLRPLSFTSICLAGCLQCSQAEHYYKSFPNTPWFQTYGNASMLLTLYHCFS